MNNNNSLSAEDIKNIYNFLFWKTNDGENSQQDTAQISFMVWVYKETSLGKGKVGSYYPPAFVAPTTPVPFLTNKVAPKVDVDITLFCNGIQTISIKDLPLGEKPLIVGQLIEIAIQQASGEIQENIAGITGYVHKQFKNEPKENTYRVTKTGDYYIVHKAVEKNNTIHWDMWDNAGPKTKSIINLFKSALANDSLQTEFTNFIK